MTQLTRTGFDLIIKISQINISYVTQVYECKLRILQNGKIQPGSSNIVEKKPLSRVIICHSSSNKLTCLYFSCFPDCLRQILAHRSHPFVQLTYHSCLQDVHSLYLTVLCNYLLLYGVLLSR